LKSKNQECEREEAVMKEQYTKYKAKVEQLEDVIKMLGNNPAVME
jgi:hypothetical protein